MLLQELAALRPFAQREYAARPSPKAAGSSPSDFDQGRESAARGDWKGAIDHYRSARYSEHYNPNLLLAVALAESKLPGRELRAAAWYRAYLALGHGVKRAPEIRRVIVELENGARARQAQMITAAKDLESQIPTSGREYVIGSVIEAQARAGQVDEALAQASALNDDSTFEKIAKSQALHGDISGAFQTIDRMKQDSPVYRGSGYADIVKIQAEAGDIAGAKSTFDRIPAGQVGYIDQALASIALAQAKAGNQDEAIATLQDAKNRVAAGNEYSRDSAYYDIASAQAAIGDIKGAYETGALTSMRKLLTYKIDQFYTETAQTLLKGGDAQGAYEAASQIKDSSRSWLMSQAAAAMGTQANAKAKESVEAGIAAAAAIPDPVVAADVYAQVAETLEQKHEYAQAQAIAERITGDPATRAFIYLRLAADLRASDPAASGRMTDLARQAVGEISISSGTSLSYGADNRLESIAEQFARAGDFDTATETIAKYPHDAYSKSSAVNAVAKSMVDRGDSSRALSLIDSYLTATSRGSAQSSVVSELAKTDHFEDATRLAGQIDDADARARAYASIAEQAASEHQISRAIVAASLAGKNQSSAYLDIARAQAASGAIDAALRTAASITEASTRGNAYSSIANAQVACSDFDGALRTAAELGDDDKIGVYLSVASSRRASGDHAGAFNTLTTAAKLVEKFSDPALRANADLRVADALSGLGEMSVAQALTAKAMAFASGTTDHPADTRRLFTGYPELMTVMQECGLSADSIDSRSIAMSAANAPGVERSDQNYFYSDVAVELAKVGDFAIAYEIAGQISDSGRRLSSLSEMISSATELGGKKQFDKLAQLILSAPEKNESVLDDLARAQAHDGDMDGALRTASRIKPDSDYSGYALREIASAYLQSGNLKRAAEVADKIQYQYARCELLPEFAKKKDFDWVRGAIREIESAATINDSCWSYIVDAESLVGDETLRTETLEHAKQFFSTATSYSRAVALRTVAGSGDIQWALDRRDSMGGDPDSVTTEIAEAYAKQGNYGEATKLARSSPSVQSKASAFRSIASAQIKAGDLSDARESFRESLTSSGKSSDDPRLADEVAYNLVVYQDSLDEAAKVAAEIRNPEIKSQAMLALAGREKTNPQRFIAAISNSGLKSRAYVDTMIRADLGKGDLAGALALLPSIELESFRTKALHEIALVAANNGDSATATAALQKIPPGQHSGLILIDVARSELDNGDVASANTALDEARKVEDAMPDDYYKAYTLAQLALVADDSGNASLADDAAKHAIEIGSRLAVKPKLTWVGYLESLATSTVAPDHGSSATHNEPDERTKKRVDAWSDFADNYPLSLDIFTDYDGAMQKINNQSDPSQKLGALVSAINTISDAFDKIKTIEKEDHRHD